MIILLTYASLTCLCYPAKPLPAHEPIARKHLSERVFMLLLCHPPNFITRSIYTNQPIIDETKTMTLPTFIRTGDTYFHEKLLHVNAMTTEFGLPSIFITLTMAESKWTHLTKILRSSKLQYFSRKLIACHD